jgi:uncharacterized protein
MQAICRKSTKATGTALGLIAILALLPGCASPPTRYYSLAEQPAGSPSSRAVQDQTGRAIVIRRISIPDFADRIQLIVHESAARVRVMEADQWAVPLRDQIPQVLARDLRTALGDQNVVLDPRLAGEAAPLLLNVEIEQFDADAGRQARVSARWSLAQRQGAPVLAFSHTAVQALADGDAETLVLAWSRCLAEIAASVASTIESAQAGVAG